MEEIRTEQAELRDLITGQAPRSDQSISAGALPQQPDFVERSIDPSDKFRRVTDPTVVYLTTLESKDITKESATAAFGVLTIDANLTKDDYTVFGDQLASRFEIKFVGTVLAAKAKATQLLQALRLGPGQYKELEAAGPGEAKIRFPLIRTKMEPWCVEKSSQSSLPMLWERFSLRKNILTPCRGNCLCKPAPLGAGSRVLPV